MGDVQKMGFYRWQEVEKIIPISKATWWEGVSKGRYPRSYKLSKNTAVWLKEDIHKLLDYIHRNGLVKTHEKWEIIKNN